MRTKNSHEDLRAGGRATRTLHPLQVRNQAQCGSPLRGHIPQVHGDRVCIANERRWGARAGLRRDLPREPLGRAALRNAGRHIAREASPGRKTLSRSAARCCRASAARLQSHLLLQPVALRVQGRDALAKLAELNLQVRGPMLLHGKVEIW